MLGTRKDSAADLLPPQPQPLRKWMKEQYSLEPDTGACLIQEPLQGRDFSVTRGNRQMEETINCPFEVPEDTSRAHIERTWLRGLGNEKACNVPACQLVLPSTVLKMVQKKCTEVKRTRRLGKVQERSKRLMDGNILTHLG